MKCIGKAGIEWRKRKEDPGRGKDTGKNIYR
jgi:hypothetical protein